MGLISNISYATASVSMGFVNAGAELKKGALYVGEGLSHMVYDVYDLRYEGFEKWTKAMVSDFRFAGRLFEMTDLFKGVVGTLEAQKDLYYASKIIGSLADFITEDKDENGRLTGTTSFTVPKAKDGGIDWVKVLYGIGNFFETGKFLQKYGVFEFKFASEIGTKLGSVRVYFFERFEKTPVLGSLSYSPKDFFVFMASSIEVYRFGCSVIYAAGNTPEQVAANRRKIVSDIGVLLKLAGSTGKMILIGFSRSSGKTMWFAVADLITNNASLFKFWLDRSRARDLRYKHPGGAAPAA